MQKVVKKKRTRIILLTCFVVFIVIGTILYLLADRYLIEHAEKVIAVTTNTSTLVDESYSSDDWSYKSDSKTIKIEKVVKGSGQDTITYYVADVKVSDATELTSAFAKNEFGTNIIEYTSEIAKNQDAIFAINGDYYGFREDGVVIRNGILYRNEPARIGLAFLKDGSMKIYDEKEISAEELINQGVWNTLSFGPALVEDGQMAGDFSKVQIDKNFGNRSIEASNPRTGVGVIEENHFIFIVVDGRSAGYSKGMTLDEFSQIFIDLGCSEAYNLDGGGSSTMYFNGKVVNKPLGKNSERGVSDILYIN